MRPLFRAGVLGLLCAVTGAQAVTLFADNEARQELLNLRQRIATLERNLQEEARTRQDLADRVQSLINTQVQEQARRKQLEQTLEALTKTTEEQARVGRGSLELLNQIEQLRQDLARLRGENEALRDFVAGFQRGLADLRQSQADLRNNLGGFRPASTRCSAPSRTPADSRSASARLNRCGFLWKGVNLRPCPPRWLPTMRR